MASGQPRNVKQLLLKIAGAVLVIVVSAVFGINLNDSGNSGNSGNAGNTPSSPAPSFTPSPAPTFTPTETPTPSVAPSSTSTDATSDPGAPSTSALPTQPPTSGTGTSGDMPATDPVSGLPYVDVDSLPQEAHDTLALIQTDGPYPENEDGTRFGNFEGILPDQPEGYYAEYTVQTPGLDHRGARRIVTGDGGEFYYTDDHYASFSAIWGWEG